MRHVGFSFQAFAAKMNFLYFLGTERPDSVSQSFRVEEGVEKSIGERAKCARQEPHNVGSGC